MMDSGRQTVTDTEGSNGAPGSPFAAVAGSLKEAKSYLTYYVSAQTDKLLLVVRNVAVFTVLGVVALVVAGTFLITATVYLCAGIVAGLEKLFGAAAWLGPTLFGLVVLTIVGVGGFIVLKKFTGGSKERLVSAYDQRQREQRSEFGTDVKREAARGGVN